MLEVVSLLFLFATGASVGSFLNVCIDRLPQGKSIVNPPSHCDSCHHRLEAADLIPVLSFLWQRGRCRHCGAAIPWRLLIVELATGILFAFLWWQYGLRAQFAISLVYACLFLVIFVIDLEHQLILNTIVYPAMVAAPVFSFFWPGLSVPMSLLGGAIGLCVMALPYVAYRGGMGGGDVKLAAMVGLATGFPYVFIALLLAILSGGVVAVFLLLSRLKKRRDHIPFGPFLAASAMATIIWGPFLWDWYLNLF